MASGRFSAVLAVLASLWTGCPAASPGGVDAESASCISADTQALAGIRLDLVRTNPLLQAALGAWTPLLDRTPDAASILFVYNGHDLLSAARGQFRTPPSGAILLSPHLALAGPDSAVRAATAQHAAGRTGAPALLAQAKAIAERPVWAVVAGNVQLPVAGNAANLSRLLAMTEFTTLAIEADSRLSLHLAGICRSADAARQLEETLRATVTLARTATHDRALAGALPALEIRRDDSRVSVDLSAPPETIQQLFGAMAR